MKSPGLRTFLRAFWVPLPKQQLPPVSRIPMLWAPDFGCHVQGRLSEAGTGAIQAWPDAGNNAPTPSRTNRRRTVPRPFASAVSTANALLQPQLWRPVLQASSSLRAYAMAFSCSSCWCLFRLFSSVAGTPRTTQTVHGLQYHERSDWPSKILSLYGYSVTLLL